MLELVLNISISISLDFRIDDLWYDFCHQIDESFIRLIVDSYWRFILFF